MFKRNWGDLVRVKKKKYIKEENVWIRFLKTFSSKFLQDIYAINMTKEFIQQNYLKWYGKSTNKAKQFNFLIKMM